MFKTAWIAEGVEFKSDGWRSYRLGPEQWLVTHPDARDDYEARRDAAIAAGGALFDVSDARVAIPAGADALAKGCGLDFERFPPGDCRATLLARVAVVILREETGFLVLAPRSYAESLRSWLTD